MTDYLAVEARIRANAPYNNPIPKQLEFVLTRDNLVEDVDYMIGYYEIADTYRIENGKHEWTEYYQKRKPKDILIGFYAPEGLASLTLEISNPSFCLPIELAAGEFKFALYGKHTYPAIRTPYHDHHFTKVVGKVYAVYGFLLSSDLRRDVCCNSLYCVADLQFSSGMVGRVPYNNDVPIMIKDMNTANEYIKKHWNVEEWLKP